LRNEVEICHAIEYIDIRQHSLGLVEALWKQWKSTLHEGQAYQVVGIPRFRLQSEWSNKRETNVKYEKLVSKSHRQAFFAISKATLALVDFRRIFQMNMAIGTHHSFQYLEPLRVSIFFRNLSSTCGLEMLPSLFQRMLVI